MPNHYIIWDNIIFSITVIKIDFDKNGIVFGFIIQKKATSQNHVVYTHFTI